MKYFLFSKNVFFGSAILLSSISGGKALCAEAEIESQAAGQTVSRVLLPSVAKEVKEALSTNDYALVGRIIKEKLGKGITLERLRKIANDLNTQSLLHAVETTKALAGNSELNAERLNLGLTRGEFFEIALFIEHNLPGHIAKGEFYLPKNATQLSCSLEYDPQTQATFVLLDDCQNTLIGFGSNKVVKKAILYNREKPQVVARGIQMETKRNEMKITNSIRGAQGIFEILACTKNMHGHRRCSTIYAKWYNSGSLYSALGKHRFSLYEKGKIALNLLKGLEELHKRHIAHRDISSRNCLIDIPAGAADKRDVLAVIADLGRSEYTWADFDTSKKPQGHSVYNPPEGIFRTSMKGKDHIRSDIFALGCVLHEVFYGKTAAWQQPKYFSRKTGTDQYRYYKLITKISSEIGSRYHRLASKRSSGHITPKEAFECLILKMMTPNPHKRGTASELRREMEQIFSKMQ